MNYILYHNPRCSKSRETLELLQHHRVPLTIVEYLKTPPSKSEIKRLLRFLKMKPRELIRHTEAEYKTLNLDDPTLTSEQLIDAMHSNPRLIQRPILLTSNAARIGRPPSAVLKIIE